ncbi:TPR and ankyrin repeat-containing protein 1-like [Saccostrea cucullata]|uniref:TPR and ankyrin repeat-containing protein 1-like n=1 Tax=Saccostrea cuccullata TaxID=36930 RepID=UPI002ED4D415
MKALYRLIQNDEWCAAENVYMDISTWVEGYKYSFDLKILCNINKVQKHPWVVQLIMELLDNGSNYHTMVIEKGESFFHTCVRLTLATGYMTFLDKIIYPLVRKREQNIQDSHGNTVLHLAVNQRTFHVHRGVQMQVVQRLLIADVNPLILNKQKKTVSKCAPRSFPELLDLVKSCEVQKQAKIREKEEEDKQKSLMLRKQMETDKKKHLEQLRIEKELRKERENEAVSLKQCTLRCKAGLEFAKEKLKSNELRLACYDLINIFNATRHKSDMHKQFEDESVQLIVNALGGKENPDIPEKLTRINQKIFLRIVHGLADKEHWKQMHIAVTEYRKYHSPSDLNDFAAGMSVEQVLNCKTFQNKEDLLLTVVTNMLRSGASLLSDGKHAIETVVQNNHFKILDRLFDFNANPSHLSVEEGDTPIHAALYIALDRDTGNTSLLARFLDTFQKHPEKYPMLNPMAENLFGESLFHVVAKAKNNPSTLEVTIMLCEKGVHSNIKDHEEKLPIEYLKSDKDKRMPYFRLALKGAKPQRAKNDELENSVNEQKTTHKKSKSEPLVHDVPLKKDKLMEEIRRMIEDLQDISMYSEDGLRNNEPCNSISKQQECSSHNLEESQKESSTSKIYFNYTLNEGTKFQIDPDFFENHEWEIECTNEVWSKLLNPSLPKSWTIHVIQKLQNLACGEFSFNCCQTIDEEIEIYESTPLLWEIAVSFSAKLSESDGKSRNVYTEIIRVWDIIEHPEEKEEAFQRISKSILRGEECIIENFVSCPEKLQEKFVEGKRIPRKYFQCSKSFSQTEEVKKLLFPASHIATEYHILKFYSFTTDMAQCAMRNMNCKKDFPFKVTEKEHSVINIISNKPILLLGRSGTGKTTCCLYRLWNRFDCHWRKEVEQKKNEGNHDEEATEDNIEYNHIRQLFITKNMVLCNEVQKCFRELRNASRIGSKRVTNDERPLPAKLQDLQNDQFPVFTTSRKLLLMLDASLPDSFFKRDSSGNLLSEVPGWTKEDDSHSFLQQCEENSESESDDGSDWEGDYFNLKNDAEEMTKKPDVRKEVNFTIFSNVVWPRINKSNEYYHPSLIWTEIISFIKGSYEALLTEFGYLSEQEYIEHGRKKAPNFTGERGDIYAIFLKYKHYLKQHCMFDETDVVRNIFKRIGRGRKDDWNIQEIYVDETQDFTQAELYLLLNICQNPNDMFLTGDTAQSIMRGISFRFKDLRSLFYQLKNYQEASSNIQIPEKIHQLTYNYRSHTGILWLASSILDVLVEYFPESFDVLQKDQGLFQGPAPILLESCDVSDLAVILKGKKQSTSRIEFGAHQAVLVVNEDARDNLPEELQQGIVLTIYEAKGLEFDDILLYNFFKDSQAGKEWRIVTDFLEKMRLSETNDEKGGKDIESLYEIDYSVFEEEGRPRPLSFNPNKHKVLNSELKHLYTAVTRARVHVWIFDESEDKRAPMFEYFKARKLVRAVKDHETSEDLMFAEESCSEDWMQRGEEFMKKSLYDVAAKCFRLGNDHRMEKIAKSHQKALLASRMHGNSALIKETFLSAAHDFLDCEVPSMAGRCLELSKEFSSAAKLYEKTNQLEKAAEIYKKIQLPVKGSKCLEQAGKYKQAISLLCDAELFESAVHCLNRFRIEKQAYDVNSEPLPKRLLDNSPTEDQTEIQLSYKAADFYHKHGKVDKMMSFLQQLPDLDEKVEFLALRDRIEQAISIIKSSGMFFFQFLLVLNKSVETTIHRL